MIAVTRASSSSTTINEVVAAARPILFGGTQVTTAAAAGTSYLFAGGTSNIAFGAGATTVSIGSTPFLAVNSADFPTLNGKAPKLGMRFVIITGATASTMNFTVGLYAYTVAAGVGVKGATVLEATATTPVANNTTATAITPVALPANGLYTFGVTPSAIPNVNVTVVAQLYAFNE